MIAAPLVDDDQQDVAGTLAHDGLAVGNCGHPIHSRRDAADPGGVARCARSMTPPRRDGELRMDTADGIATMKQRDIARARRRHDEQKAHLIAEERHDPYKARAKRAGPCVCPGCGAVYARGRWQWDAHGAGLTARETCPACHRTADGFPAGRVTLSGSFLAAHRDEIVALVRNTEARERRTHPLQRIMSIGAGENDGELVVTTTDLHLPRRIGHALVDAFKGDLRSHYDDAGYFMRVEWRRDA
jgi:hypothetical protein